MDSAPSSKSTAPAAMEEPRRLGDLPGPRTVPFFGNMLQLKRGSVHQTVERWAGQYGPLFRMRVGQRTFLVISDHKLNAEILRDRPEGFQRSSRLGTVMTEMGLFPGVFIANGQAWQRQRRLVMAAFDPPHVRSYYPSLLQVALRLRESWSCRAVDGNYVDLLSDLTRYTVDGVSGLAFGVPVNTIDGSDDVIQKHLDKIFPAMFRRVMSPLSYWRYFRLKADRELPGHVQAINGAVRGFILQARKRMSLDPALFDRPTNLLEAMLAAASTDSENISDDEIAGNVFTMLLAGEDTTANTLAWLIWLLFVNPPQLKRCQEEVDALVTSLGASTMDEISRLTFLDACINEAMRLKPIAPFMISQAVRDIVVGDVLIPKGTFTWSVLRHDAVDDRYFTSPDKFLPERWTPSEARGLGLSKRVSMPFGGGPRMCPGRYLALLEIKLAMAMLLSSFEIKDVSTESGLEPREAMNIVMAPVGLRLRITPRGDRRSGGCQRA